MARALIFKPLLLACAIVFADESPLCQFYTPGERLLSCDYGLSVKTEGLFWRARENHLICGITLAGLTPTDQIPPALDRWNFQGEVVRIEPDWDWGWRAGLSYTSACDYWDVLLDWTSFHTSQGRTFNLFELPGWNCWGYPDTAQAVRFFDLNSLWNLKYDSLTLAIGRVFWIGKYLTLHPRFGVVASSIDQTLQHTFDYEPQNFIPFGSNLTLDCDFSGGGLLSGFTLHFTSGTGLGIFGKICYQLIYGKFETDMKQTEFFENTSDTLPNHRRLIADSQDNFYTGISSLQGSLGINWNHCFCCDRYRFGLNLQWEFNQIGNINKFSHFFYFLSEGIHRQESTSLNLMGITFGGTFDF